MQVLTLLFSLFHVAIPFFMINDASMLRALFGNVTEMRDLFLPPPDNISSAEESPIEEENDIQYVKEYIKDMKMNSYGQDDDVDLTLYNHDLTEFNTISNLLDEEIVNHKGPLISRRMWLMDDEDVEDIEFYKKNLTFNLMLTMVIHIRFKVDMAVRQRQLARSKKGYRLGYLFSRLRNIKFEMAKVVNMLTQRDYERHNFRYNVKRIVDYHQYDALRLYEKVMRQDADARAIINLINEVVHEVNPSTTTDAD